MANRSFSTDAAHWGKNPKIVKKLRFDKVKIAILIEAEMTLKRHFFFQVKDE